MRKKHSKPISNRAQNSTFWALINRKGLARAEILPLLMPRLRRISCTQVLSIERSFSMPISIILQQQEQEEAVVDAAEDPPRGEDPIPDMKVEVERSPVLDSSPPSPPPTAPSPANTAGPSYIAQQSPEHIHVSSRELAAVMDAVCALATTRASLDQRMTRAKVTLAHSHAMLLQIMSHLDLPAEPIQPTRDQSTVAASLDMLAAVAAASDPPASPPPRE